MGFYLTMRNTNGLSPAQLLGVLGAFHLPGQICIAEGEVGHSVNCQCLNIPIFHGTLAITYGHVVDCRGRSASKKISLFLFAVMKYPNLVHL